MFCTGWRLGALAVGACLALAGTAVGDDTFDLKLRKSTGASALDEFTHDARAHADEDDVEDINLRYRLGYNRGYYGGGWNVLPRAYAFRSGYYNGRYGYPYYSAWRGYAPVYRGYYGRPYYGSYWGGYRSYYSSYYGSYYSSYSYPVYSSYYYTTPIIYSDPCDYVGISNAVTQVLPATRLKLPATTEPMAEPEPPAANPTPAAKPTYRYDGGPNDPKPLPPQPGEPAPKPSKQAAPKLDAPEGRLVKLQGEVSKPKKPTYPAYGEHLRSAEGDELFLKQPKKK